MSENPFGVGQANVDLFKQAHMSNDVDFERDSYHHTLGLGATQAAPGNHTHLLDEHKVPAMLAYHNTVQTIPNATVTRMTQWAYRYSHPEIVYQNGGDFRIDRAGYYDIKLEVMYRNNISSNGMRGALIYHNGNQIAGHYAPPIAAQADYANANTSIVFDCPVGTVINFHALHTAGGNVDLHVNPYVFSCITWLGDL